MNKDNLAKRIIGISVIHLVLCFNVFFFLAPENSRFYDINLWCLIVFTPAALFELYLTIPKKNKGSED